MKMTTDELAQSIKLKYPVYKNIDNQTLVLKVVEKYPEYANQIDDKSLLQKAGEFLGKSTTSNIATVGNLGNQGNRTDQASVNSQQAFEASNALTQQAKQETDPTRKAELLDQARAIMQGSEEAMNAYQKDLSRRQNLSNITEKDLNRSNLEFAGRRGLGQSAELASYVVPGKIATGATTAGGRIAQAGLRGAVGGGYQGIAEATRSADTFGEAGKTIGTGTVIGAGTGAALQALGEGAKYVGGKIRAKNAQPVKTKVGEIVDESKVKTRQLRDLDQKQRRNFKRDATEFTTDNQLNIPKEAGKRLKPYDTLFELNDDLTAEGKGGLRGIDSQSLYDRSRDIVDDTSDAVWDTIERSSDDIPKVTISGNKKVDTIQEAVDDAIKNSSELNGEKSGQALKKKISDLIDEAQSSDINSYNSNALFKVQKQLEVYAAQTRAAGSRNTESALLKGQQSRVYQAAVDAIANMTDKLSVNDTIFQENKANLIKKLLDKGYTAQADKVAQTANISQLRSTIKAPTRYSMMVELSLEGMFSTMNKNTYVSNRLLKYLGTSNPVRWIAEGADVLTGGRTTRLLDNAISDVQEGVSGLVRENARNQAQSQLPELVTTLSNLNQSQGMSNLQRFAVPAVARFTIEKKE